MKISVSGREQDVQRYPLGVLRRARLDQRDHAIVEDDARLTGDFHDDLIRGHPRAARHRAAVAAGLADDRSRLAGDRGSSTVGDASISGAIRQGSARRAYRDDVPAASSDAACGGRRSWSRPSPAQSRAACPPAPATALRERLAMLARSRSTTATRDQEGVPGRLVPAANGLPPNTWISQVTV